MKKVHSLPNQYMKMEKYLNKMKQLVGLLLFVTMPFFSFLQELPGFFYTSEFQKIVLAKKVKEIHVIQNHEDYGNSEHYKTINYLLSPEGQVKTTYYSETKLNFRADLFTPKDSIYFKQLIYKEYRIDSTLHYALVKNFQGIDPHGYAPKIGFRRGGPLFAVDSSLLVYQDERNYYVDSFSFPIIDYNFDMASVHEYTDGKLNGLRSMTYYRDNWEKTNSKFELKKENDTLDFLHFVYSKVVAENVFPVYQDTSGISDVYKSEINEITKNIESRIIQMKTSPAQKNQITEFIQQNTTSSFKHEKMEYGILDKINSKNHIVHFAQSFYLRNKKGKPPR